MNQIIKSSRIAIIGAGIGGLALGIALKLSGYINVHIWEKDISFDCRRQGYGLTILQAKKILKKLEIFQDTKKQNAPTKVHYIFDEKGTILGFYGTLFWDELNNNRSLKSTEKGLSMHIPRQQLRKILMNKFLSFDNNSLFWNKRLEDIHYLNNQLQLKFQADSIIKNYDLIIGCDGINSNVRKLVLDEQKDLNYLGILVVLGICGSNNFLTKQRIFQTTNGTIRFYSMPFMKESNDSNVMWQLSMPLPHQKSKFFIKNISIIQQELCSLTKSWHDPIFQMIKDTKIENIMAVPAYDRDPSENLKLKIPKVCLLGDAAHPMSPFKGQGANQALIDAFQLSETIQNYVNSDKIISIFHQKMMVRASKKVLESRLRAQKYHNQSFRSIQNFIYPRITKNFIVELQESGINAFSGCEIQNLILKKLKRQRLIK